MARLNERQRAQIARNRAGAEGEALGRVISHQGYQLVVAVDEELLLADWRQHLGDIVCNDRVRLSRSGDRAVIEALLPRGKSLHKWQGRGQARPLAANLDQLLLVIAPEPAWQENLLERFLLAALAEDLPLALLVNKCDLPRDDTAARLAAYPQLKIFWGSASSGAGLAELGAWLAGKQTLFCGQSGVGKSSLINYFQPEAAAWTQAISELSRLGKHTTTNVRLYRAPGDTTLIDSPGVRGWHIQHYDEALIHRAYADIGALHCRFSDCGHGNEPGCAVREALADGRLSPQRFANYQQLLAEKRRGR